MADVTRTAPEGQACRFESREDPPGSGNCVAWCQTHLCVHTHTVVESDARDRLDAAGNTFDPNDGGW